MAVASVCSASVAPAARAVTIEFVNGAGVPNGEVRHFERAATVQAEQLRTWWRTPAIRFRTGGWRLEVLPPNDPRVGKYLGWHDFDTQPFAVAAHTSNWTRIASHELLEMLVDPRGGLIRAGYQLEVCDPVKALTYSLWGVALADFVTPAWFSGGTGPYDYLRTVSTAHSVEFGFAVAVTPGGGFQIVGRGPF